LNRLCRVCRKIQSLIMFVFIVYCYHFMMNKRFSKYRPSKLLRIVLCIQIRDWFASDARCMPALLPVALYSSSTTCFGVCCGRMRLDVTGHNPGILKLSAECPSEVVIRHRLRLNQASVCPFCLSERLGGLTTWVFSRYRSILPRRPPPRPPCGRRSIDRRHFTVEVDHANTINSCPIAITPPAASVNRRFANDTS